MELSLPHATLLPAPTGLTTVTNPSGFYKRMLKQAKKANLLFPGAHFILSADGAEQDHWRRIVTTYPRVLSLYHRVDNHARYLFLHYPVPERPWQFAPSMVELPHPDPSEWEPARADFICWAHVFGAFSKLTMDGVFDIPQHRQ